MPYPTAPHFVPPWSLANTAALSYCGSFASPGPEMLNMLVFGCWYHSGPS